MNEQQENENDFYKNHWWYGIFYKRPYLSYIVIFIFIAIAAYQKSRVFITDFYFRVAISLFIATLSTFILKYIIKK